VLFKKMLSQFVNGFDRFQTSSEWADAIGREVHPWPEPVVFGIKMKLQTSEGQNSGTLYIWTFDRAILSVYAAEMAEQLIQSVKGPFPYSTASHGYAGDITFAIMHTVDMSVHISLARERCFLFAARKCAVEIWRSKTNILNPIYPRFQRLRIQRMGN
jgi:hypothetical protein